MMSLCSIAAPDCHTSQSKGRYYAHGFNPIRSRWSQQRKLCYFCHPNLRLSSFLPLLFFYNYKCSPGCDIIMFSMVGSNLVLTCALQVMHANGASFRWLHLLDSVTFISRLSPIPTSCCHVTHIWADTAHGW